MSFEFDNDQTKIRTITKDTSVNFSPGKPKAKSTWNFDTSNRGPDRDNQDERMTLVR